MVLDEPRGRPSVVAVARGTGGGASLMLSADTDHPWMDAALTAVAGIPTAVFGPGGAGAHAAEEYGDLRSVEQRAAVLVDTARRLCA